jgi:methyl acetate hydrolase
MERSFTPLLEEMVGSGRIPPAVALIADETDILFETAVGTSAAGGGGGVTPESVFWLASMTKPVVTAAALHLVEQGKISLTAPLADVRPELARPQVLEGFDETGEPRLRPARGSLTLHHLLTHTSGFGYDFGNADLLRFIKTRNLPPVASGKRAAFGLPLLFDPGTRWEYGIGIDWAGLVIEAASGMRLADYVRKNITEPLGMRQTGFGLDPARRARRVPVHGRDEGGRLSVLGLEPPEAPEVDAGGHGLYGSPRDYLRFAQMILREGERDGVRLLSAETVRKMGTNQVGALAAGTVRSVVPQMALEVPLPEGVRFKWGYGFLINEDPLPTGRRAGSLAWSGVANTYFWIDREARLIGIFMTQLLPFGDPAVITLLTAFESAAYRAFRPG